MLNERIARKQEFRKLRYCYRYRYENVVYDKKVWYAIANTYKEVLAMAKETLEQAVIDAKEQIERSIDEFKAVLDSGTVDPDNFITLAEIERKWAELRHSTDKTYSDMVSAYLSGLDEAAMIKAKKENTQERG